MNQRGKELDKTFLSINQAAKRGFLHRDYIAHCFRWSHVIKKLMKKQRYKQARILDVGCGRELPFPKTLYSSKMIPHRYVGVDAGPLKPEDVEIATKGKMGSATELYEHTVFCKEFANKLGGDPPTFTDIVCFEVAEHMEPKPLRGVLKTFASLLDPGNGRLWISTPCWDRRSCAANHVNEMTYGAFGAVLESCGLRIEDVHGTFASIRDYEDVLPPAYKEVFYDLRKYYDTNVLSTILAPMFPAYSRNCLWECRKMIHDDHAWNDIESFSRPWGSSEKWREMSDPPFVDPPAEEQAESMIG